MGPATSLPDNVEVYSRSLPYNNGDFGIVAREGSTLVFTHPVVDRWRVSTSSLSLVVTLRTPNGEDVVWSEVYDLANDCRFDSGRLFLPVTQSLEEGILFLTIIDQQDSRLAHKFIRINEAGTVGQNWLSVSDSACFSSATEVAFYKQGYGVPLPITNHATTSLHYTNADSLITYGFLDERKCYKFQEIGYVGLHSANENRYRAIVAAGYPEIRTAGELVASLRYLMYDSTWMNLSQREQKYKVDSFWLSLTTGQEQARKLLQAYYRHVQFANSHFTDWRPGYLTDRGAVYILLGAPDALYLTMETERWVYFPEGNGPGEQFVFRHMEQESKPGGWYLDWKPHYANLLSWGRDRWLNGKIVFFQLQD